MGLLERPGSRWEDNITIDLKVRDNMVQVNVVQERNDRHVENTVINIPVS
jgi:hypothetical protein